MGWRIEGPWGDAGIEGNGWEFLTGEWESAGRAAADVDANEEDAEPGEGVS